MCILLGSLFLFYGTSFFFRCPKPGDKKTKRKKLSTKEIYILDDGKLYNKSLVAGRGGRRGSSTMIFTKIVVVVVVVADVFDVQMMTSSCHRYRRSSGRRKQTYMIRTSTRNCTYNCRIHIITRYSCTLFFFGRIYRSFYRTAPFDH